MKLCELLKLSFWVMYKMLDIYVFLSTCRTILANQRERYQRRSSLCEIWPCWLQPLIMHWAIFTYWYRGQCCVLEAMCLWLDHLNKYPVLCIGAPLCPCIVVWACLTFEKRNLLNFLLVCVMQHGLKVYSCLSLYARQLSLKEATLCLPKLRCRVSRALLWWLLRRELQHHKWCSIQQVSDNLRGEIKRDRRTFSCSVTELDFPTYCTLISHCSIYFHFIIVKRLDYVLQELRTIRSIVAAINRHTSK